MDDYIKRQDVLDAIWLVDPENDGADGGTVVLQNLELTSSDVESIVSEIPAADVRPVVRGRWERIDGLDELDPRMRCSVCGSVETPLARHRFCPVCAADMKEGGTDG
ncbi:hypothetical protein B5E65_12285 [Gemmiger sp. An120]|uniref:hypothetical protein n=1 Tax=Gemmiger sp. An120 TaxID=1965549 RepID=UPI000B36A7A8|nr:hypothetical protein [Gemmiger sp. An120]OUQ41406.1 hypothetical protein B5E65_12285 [Gemmiger sp. An120]